MFLLIGNSRHLGIEAVTLGYKRAFEHLGIDFQYFSFASEPNKSIGEINTLVDWKINNVKKNCQGIIFIQPTYLMMPTLVNILFHKIPLYAINTEDPYNTEPMMMVAPLFKKIFTNERVVAHKLKWEYLPVAHDSLQPYKVAEKRDIDITNLSTIYHNRYKVLQKINEMQGIDKFIGGYIAPMVKDGAQVDMSLFTSGITSIMPRHKELELYTRSKFVLNLHRPIDITGMNYLQLGEGKVSRPIFTQAESVNPRFYDTLACGAIPISDRKEGIEFLNDLDVPIIDPLHITPDALKELDGSSKECGIKFKYVYIIDIIKRYHSYINSAKRLLDVILEVK